MPSRSGSEPETASSATVGCDAPAICAGAARLRDPITHKATTANRGDSKRIARSPKRFLCEATSYQLWRQAADLRYLGKSAEIQRAKSDLRANQGGEMPI